MNTIRTIQFYGGPLDGRSHEIADPFDMGVEPGAIGQPVEGGMAWYRRDLVTDEYRYDRTEPDRALPLDPGAERE